MGSKITYWASNALIALSAAMAAFAYLSGSPQAVQGFTHIGYPQQLRIILGIAKPLAAIVLLIPGFLRLKEWHMPDWRSLGSAPSSPTLSLVTEESALPRSYC
jgi:hypothetical protein